MPIRGTSAHRPRSAPRVRRAARAGRAAPPAAPSIPSPAGASSRWSAPTRSWRSAARATPRRSPSTASTTTRRVAAYVDSVGQRVARASELPNLDVALHRARRSDRQRVRHAGRLHLRHARHPRAPELRGAARRRARPRDRARHRTPLREADHAAADRGARAGGSRAACLDDVPAVQRRGAAGARADDAQVQPRRRDRRPTSWAIRYATAAGYDPREIPATYAMLKRVSQRGGQLAAVLPVHAPRPGRPRGAHDRARRAGRRRPREPARCARSALPGARARPRLRRRSARRLVRGRALHAAAAGIRAGRSRPAGRRRTAAPAVAAAEPQQTRRDAADARAPTRGALAPADYVAALRRDGRVAGCRGPHRDDRRLAGVGRRASRCPRTDGRARDVLVAAWVRVGARSHAAVPRRAARRRAMPTSARSSPRCVRCGRFANLGARTPSPTACALQERARGGCVLGAAREVRGERARRRGGRRS